MSDKLNYATREKNYSKWFNNYLVLYAHLADNKAVGYTIEKMQQMVDNMFKDPQAKALCRYVSQRTQAY